MFVRGLCSIRVHKNHGAVSCVVGSAVASNTAATTAGWGGLGGWRTMLPRRGGVERLMNSILVGSLSEAWRSARGTKPVSLVVNSECIEHTVSGKFLSDWCAANFKYNASCWYSSVASINLERAR